ncbi:hypothetical protein niasHT_025985 [Heterodera trifolii]|uniref:PNPLA domain-containing protein n=1 Tax=Heterodera trifolii TaxID=157864 RepID=A0ABD2JA82_9BILA
MNKGKTRSIRKGIGVRALSLDGGGIRGVVLVQMLIEIESMMNGVKVGAKALQLDYRDEHRSDRCVGTCRGHLTDRLPPTLLAPEGFGVWRTGAVDRLQRAKFGIIPQGAVWRKQQNGRMIARKLWNLHSLFTTATYVGQKPPRLVKFRNFTSALNEYNPYKTNIWQAANYSSAAPTYFESAHKFMDGDWNCWRKSARKMHWPKNTTYAANPHHELECFVSLGTGKAPTVPVGTTLLEIGTALIEAIKKLAGILMDQTKVAQDTIEDRILVETLWEARTYIREQCEQDVHDLNEMLH